MKLVLLLIATILQLGGLLLIQQKNSFTTNKTKRLGASVLFLLSTVSLTAEYGILAGIIISVSLLSLLGMLYSLFKKQITY